VDGPALSGRCPHARRPATPEGSPRRAAASSRRDTAEYLLENLPEALTRSLDGLQRINVIVRSMKDFAHPDELAQETFDRPLSVLLAEALNLTGRDRFERLVVFSSLSKRSNVPGLRSGFVAGDARSLAAQPSRLGATARCRGTRLGRGDGCGSRNTGRARCPASG